MTIWLNPLPPYDGTLTVSATPEASCDLWTFPYIVIFKVVAQCKSLGAPSANYIVADMSDLNQTEMVIEKAAAFMG